MATNDVEMGAFHLCFQNSLQLHFAVIAMMGLLKHKEDCKKTALNLKSTLHQATKYLEGQLVSSPENHLLEDEWKRMKECLALVSYKLLINEQIKLNDFSM